MYKVSLHYPKGDVSELTPPAVGYALHSVVAMSPTTLAAVWQQEGKVEVEWGGQAWRYTPKEVEFPVEVE